MSFNWFDVIVLFGILQGVVSAALLLCIKSSNAATRLLAAMLFVFSVLSFKIVLHTLGLWDSPLLRYFPLAIDLLIQPLLYLYVVALILPKFKLRGRQLLHLLPPALLMLHAIVVYIAVLPVSGLSAKDAIAGQLYFNQVKSVEDVLSVISGIVYGLLSFRLVQRYRGWLYKNISGTAYPTFTWLKNVLLLTGILGAGLMANVLLDQVFHFNARHFLHWEIFYVYLSGLIYYIAIKSYQQKNGVVAAMPNDEKARPAELAVSKYTHTELATAKEAISLSLGKEKLFLNNELTLSALAAHIMLSPALVSEAINKGFGMPFRSLINNYRVEEVKQKLANEKLSHLSILGIAFESGFNSEASFYRIFKAATGESPKSYLAKTKKLTPPAAPRLS
ncbi:helix-turn-helix transcriptional regulator [Mucilaginibacter sp. ZT4R22]|uniref:Helix-turn-helix transcriptional regulator n=1 Tax=Mucilaginibacter pankratovii TaxID=2772110 RepID=A0ABR7WMB5_9SPHI|nr:helix-turn-helix transcriptional regulator [Mucilaginibacter pankratovii]MBD1363461.1 helix-turn-helix transcriptional regulator [Mucilaginibacter pankratovii]